VLVSLICGAGPRQGDHRRGILCWVAFVHSETLVAGFARHWFG